jgi:hypothetical protein
MGFSRLMYDVHRPFVNLASTGSLETLATDGMTKPRLPLLDQN